MTTKTVTIGGEGGSVVITKTDYGTTMTTAAPPPGSETGMPIVLHRHHEMPAGAAFAIGLIVGVLLLLLVQRFNAARRHRPVRLDRDDRDADRMAADVAALARRTATLETIVTDPAQRTAREIEALR